MGIFSTVKNWYESQDTQQKINVTFNFLSDGFRVVMASLLSVFVPQNCNGQICSLNENLTGLSAFNIFTLVFNFFTLFCFLLLYTIELRREKWMIEYFDYEKEADELHLSTYRQIYPEVFKILDNFNKAYFKAYSYLKYVYVINFFFSAILVLYLYYYDYRSVTVLLTNVALCWAKITHGNQLSKDSLQKGIAYSFFNVKNLSFNVMDKKWLRTIIVKESFV